jgi:mycothiol synthase
VEGDARGVHRLSAALDAALGALPALDEELLRRMWGRPRFDLETDAWVVERDEGSLVGYAQVWAEDSAHLSGFAIVHPEHLGRGLGGALAGLIEDRSAELAAGEARLHSATIPEDDAAARLLTARGYAWARRFWHLQIELGGPREASVPPKGIVLRTLDPDRDLVAVHAVLEEAFQDHWDFVPTSFEEFLDQNVRVEEFDPDLWIVALDGDRPVGVLAGAAPGDRGAVDLLGVLRSHRGRGIASALLTEGFLAFWRRGLPRARLSVDSDNPTGAVALYERMGMRPVASYDLWALSVRGERASRPR